MGLKKLAKSIGIGGILGGGAGALSMGLLGGGEGVKDFLLGKKKGGFSADEIAGEIRRVQGKGILTAEKGLERLNQALEKDGGELAAQAVREGVAKEQKGILTSAQDARRRAQQMIAQRGLQGSSLGLSADRSATQEMGKQMASAQAKLAQIPLAMRQQQLADAQMLQGAGTGLFGGLGGSAGVRFHGQEGSRSGGVLGVASALAPLAGTVAGGIFGGPMGAMAGGQVGGAIGGAMQPKPLAMNYQSTSGSYA